MNFRESFLRPKMTVEQLLELKKLDANRSDSHWLGALTIKCSTIFVSILTLCISIDSILDNYSGKTYKERISSLNDTLVVKEGIINYQWTVITDNTEVNQKKDSVIEYTQGIINWQYGEMHKKDSLLLYRKE